MTALGTDVPSDKLSQQAPKRKRDSEAHPLGDSPDKPGSTKKLVIERALADRVDSPALEERPQPQRARCSVEDAIARVRDRVKPLERNMLSWNANGNSLHLSVPGHDS